MIGKSSANLSTMCLPRSIVIPNLEQKNCIGTCCGNSVLQQFARLSRSGFQTRSAHRHRQRSDAWHSTFLEKRSKLMVVLKTWCWLSAFMPTHARTAPAIRKEIRTASRCQSRLHITGQMSRQLFMKNALVTKCRSQYIQRCTNTGSHNTREIRMDEQRRQKLGQPPGICDECWNNQQFHTSDEYHECFYCSKCKAMALPRPGCKLKQRECIDRARP